MTFQRSSYVLQLSPIIWPFTSKTVTFHLSSFSSSTFFTRCLAGLKITLTSLKYMVEINILHYWLTWVDLFHNLEHVSNTECEGYIQPLFFSTSWKKFLKCAGDTISHPHPPPFFIFLYFGTRPRVVLVLNVFCTTWNEGCFYVRFNMHLKEYYSTRIGLQCTIYLITKLPATVYFSIRIVQIFLKQVWMISQKVLCQRIQM